MRKNKFIQTPGRGPMAKYKEVAKLLGPQANGNDDKIDPTTGVKNTSSITVPKPLTSQEKSRIGLWKADTESKSFTINEGHMLLLLALYCSCQIDLNTYNYV